MVHDDFKVGETALIGRAVSYPQLVGLECTVLSAFEEYFVNGMGWVKGHLIEIPGAPSRGFPARIADMDGWLIHPVQLRKLPRPQQASAWSECCWQPQGMSRSADHD